MENIGNKKIIIISLLILGIITVGATYAFFTATVSRNNLNTTSSNFAVIYTGGEELDGPIKLLNSKEDGASSTTVQIKMAEDSVQAEANLYINIENISENIATEGFIWEVEGYQDETLVYENDGTFDGTEDGDRIKIVDKFLLSEVATDFTVYFWIDGSKVDSEILNSTFKGTISADTEPFTGELE